MTDVALAHPQPSLRRDWTSLDGTWEFAVADAARRPGDVDFAAEICVPFAPETIASGIGHSGAVECCWYRRIVDVDSTTAPVVRSCTSQGSTADNWGYDGVATPDDLLERYRALWAVVHSSNGLAGACWTQLTDTYQEVNGLLRADRSPKVDVAAVRTTGRGSPTSTSTEQPTTQPPTTQPPTTEPPTTEQPTVQATVIAEERP